MMNSEPSSEIKKLILSWPKYCPCHKEELVFVHIDKDLSCTGHEKIKPVKVDLCVIPFVNAFQQAGINMRASCCGHGKGPMRIDLSDGRIIKIYGNGHG